MLGFGSIACSLAPSSARACRQALVKLQRLAAVHPLPHASCAVQPAVERLQADMINDVRQAAEVHRQVRAYVRTIAKPGILMSDLCEKLEDAGAVPLGLGGWA